MMRLPPPSDRPLWPLVASTPERQKFIHFSDPYLRLTYWMVTMEGTPTPQRWDGERVSHSASTVPPKLPRPPMTQIAKIRPM